MIEALAYAKEAHRLRSKLLQQKFVYSVEKMTERFDKDGVVVEKSYYGIQTFKVKDVLMVKGSCNYEDCVLTPWNVLSCYLESLLQVGVVQEILGNGSEAEMLLRWGRNISQYKSLPLFEIAFASMLGKLYRKQKLCCMAEKELSSAKKTLVDNRDIISCEKCASMLEVSINQQIGDVFLSSSCSTGESPLTERQLNAKSLYESALHKLNLSEWMSSISTSDEARADHVISRESSLSRCAINPSEENDTLPIDKPNKIEPRRSRRIKKENKPVPQRQDMACGHNRRITRSTNRSRGETSDTQNGCTAGLATEHVSESYSDNKMANVEAKSPFADFHSVMASVSNKMKCWHCLYIETVGCSSLNNFINLNWELAYRKLSLRLFLSIGKYFGICGDAHEAHKLLLQSMAVLFRRNSLCPRKICCELSAIGTTRIVSWLRLAFILSREVPVLFQKIARLLAAIYVLSTSLKPFSLSPNEEGSESLWASFFHQASLGTHLDQRIFFGMMQKKQSQIATDLEDSLLPNSTSTFSETPGSLRVAFLI